MNLRALVEATADLASCRSREELFRSALGAAGERLGMSRCAVFVREGSTVTGYLGGSAGGGGVAVVEFPVAGGWEQVFAAASPGCRWFRPVGDDQGGGTGPGDLEAWAGFSPLGAGLAGEGVDAVFALGRSPAGAAAEVDAAVEDAATLFAVVLGDALRRLAAAAAPVPVDSHLRAAFEDCPDPICVLKIDGGSFVAVNAGFMELTGFAAEEVIGKPALEVGIWMNKEDHESIVEQIQERGAIRNLEAEFKTKDGRVVPCLVSAKIAEIDGERHIIAVGKHIAEWKEAEEAREALEAQLRHAQKMETMGRLAGGIAHDFNNILAGILGYTELALMGSPKGSPVREDLNQVVGSVGRAKEIVQQILTFSRRDSKDKERVHLHLLVRESLRLIRATLPTTVEIVPNIATEEAVVLASPSQVNQVLINLCTNAYQSMPEGGVIEVGLEVVDSRRVRFDTLQPFPGANCVHLYVSDTGNGMDDRIRERAFEPFFTTRAVGEGSGLGLSVVHGIVASHQGEIIVSSVPGKGTTIHLYFPVAKGAHAPPLATLPRGPTPAGKAHVLFVDDNPELVSAGRRILEGLGYTVTAERDSTSALKRFRANPSGYDIAVTDQTMPRMTGVQLAAAMRAVRPEIPIVIASGFNETVTPDNIARFGIRRYVHKPYSASAIGDAIEEALAEAPNGTAEPAEVRSVLG